jgi:hypothetical protein
MPHVMIKFSIFENIRVLHQFPSVECCSECIQPTKKPCAGMGPENAATERANVLTLLL